MQPRQRPLFCRLLLSLSFFSLLAGPAKVEAQLNASFTVSATSGCTPLTVQFTNTSTGAVSYYWDFGNGNFSTAVNPSNVYLSPGNFSVKLVAYSAGGAADSVVLQNGIQVVNPPVVSFTASPRTVCLSGNQVSFTNLSSGFDSCFWDFGDGATSSLNNPVHHYTAIGTYSVTLIAYNNQMGCQNSITKTAYINVIGSGSASISVNQNVTCDSAMVFQFSGSPANSWYWSFGNGGTSNQQNPSYAYNQSGTFNVMMVATDAQGCSDTVHLNTPVQVKSNPLPDMSITASMGNCAPSQLTFNANVQGSPSYVWDFGDTTYAFTAGPVSHYYAPGTYVPTLTVTYPNGCVNSDTLPALTFYSNLVPYFNVNTAQACAPASITFTPYNLSYFSSFLWDFGDGTTSTSPNPVHVYNSPGSYTVTLTTTNTAGCVNSVVWSQGMVVNSLDASFTADDLSGCVPHTVNFSFPGSSGMTYFWDFGDGSTSFQMSPSHTYNTNGNYTVSLAVTDASGCAASFTLPSQVQVTNGVNNFSPAPPISACAPFTVNLFDNSPATSSWSWDFGDGTTSSDQNPTHTYMTPGTYQVSLTTQSTGSNCSQFVNPYRIYIIKGGEAEFDVTQTICPPYTATFTDQSVNAASWLWDFGDGNTSTLQHPVHVYSAPGNYNVTLTITTTDGCVYEKVHNYAVTFLPLTANATAVTTDTILPMNVQFYANSIGATAWFWDFGDGGTSTLMNPIHTYTGSGPYNVTLTISNPGCSFTYVYTGVTIGSGAIIPGGPPDSLHVPDPVFSCIPYEMNFNNPVLNTVAWLWDFGDGDTSTQENPVHIYTDAGTFTVTLITWDAFGNTDTVVQPSAINLIGAEADFVFSNMNNCQGSTILTTNSSTNAFSYMWDFGDGTTSTQFEPTHTFNTTGVNYIISLTVTDSGGCTDFMSRSYYAASVSAISANTRKACANDTVYFDSGSLNYVTYLWDFGDGNTSALQNPWHVYSDSGSFTVTLTVTDTANCVITYTLPYNIKVNKPVAAFSHQVNINGCSAMTVQLTNQSTGADSWYWDFGNGVTSSQLNPVASYPLSQWGSHDITLVAFASGCADTFIVSNAITVPHLTADFSFTQSSECFPITATFTDLSTDAVSWQWEFGDGSTSTVQNPVHVFDSLPSGDIKLMVTDIRGCVNGKILPNIQAMVADFSFSDTAGCKPFVLAITDSSSGVASWNWNFGDGSLSALANPSHTYNTIGNFNVSLTVTAPSGCTQVIGPKTVTVTGPQANFTSANVVSCAPTVVNFTDLSSGAGNWSWDFGDGGISILQDPVHIYNQPGTYSVSLAITDSIGCSDTILIPDMVHITGSIANFSVTAASGCSPWQVTFADSSISAFTWQWNFGDGNTSTVQNPVHTYSTPGTYTVTLMTQDTTGCQSVFSSQTPISILQPPVAAFATTDTVGCAPFDVHFQQNSVSAASWFWDFGDGNVSSAAAPSHTYQQPGVYTVTLIVSSPDGCSDTLVYANMIKVGLTPQPSFIPSVAQGCPPLQVQFYNTSVDTVSGSVFAWSFGNGVAGAGFQPSYSFQQPGVYDITLQVTNPYGCVASVTSPALIQVLNNAPLPPVQLRSVSVQDAASIEITWGNLAAQNLGAYELYRFNDMSGAFDLIYTDLNPGNSSMNVNSVYTDTGLNTTDKSYTYVARAVNTCAVATPMASLQQHSSVNVEAVEQNGNVQVTWNSYGGCPVSGYEVYREDQLSGSFVMIASVGASDLSFLDTTLYCGMDVSYRIKALSVCGLPYDAWSDTSVTEVPGTIISQPVGVVRSTVVDDSFVLTEWAPPVQMPQTVTGYEIYRSADGISFDLLTVVPAFQTSYEDHGVDVDAANYFYRVKVVNICQLDPGMGTMGSSIWLQTTIDDENISKLRWTRYEYWDTGVDYYVIERMDLNGGWKVIGTVLGSQTDYTDR